MDKKKIKETIAKSVFLNGCGFLCESSFVLEHKKGSFVYDIIDGVSYVGLIAEGEVTVHLVADYGGETHLSTLLPEGCFGVSNLLCDRPLETTLRCKGLVKIIYIPKSEIISEMKKNPGLAMRYASHCNDKITFLLKRINSFTMQTGSKRLAKHLLQQGGNNTVVTLTTTREKFASYLGISRAALYRELAALESKGAVELNEKSIIIKDEQILANILYGNN